MKSDFVNDIKNVSQYTTIEKHGEGSMGIAYKLTDVDGNGIIKKAYKDMVKEDYRYERRHRSFKNEVKIMKELSGEKHFPQLLYHDIKKYEIYMTNCGEKISEENAPENWKDQLRDILKILKKHKIAHNSTAINNTCVKDDVMYFIDFASSGDYRPKKRNMTKKIIKEAKDIYDAYDSKKTREIPKRRRRRKEREREQLNLKK